jgi:myo-inositol-1(or 4)-monophosphatase
LICDQKGPEQRMNPLMATALEAAREAGRILNERLPKEREVETKGPRDIVTDADWAAERAIVEIIRARHPDHALLTEESGASGDSPYVWVVDPLDGTTNYSRRFPVFSVSIGVVHAGELVVGVVYDPVRDQCFAAERGAGATLNGEPMRVSSGAGMPEAVIGLDWAHAEADRREIVRQLEQVAPACRTLRCLGSAALGLCYVAAGWLEAYFHIRLEPHDLAAGVLLVREAGGRVTDLNGEAWKPWGQQILASNGLTHETLVNLMKES